MIRAVLAAALLLGPGLAQEGAGRDDPPDPRALAAAGKTDAAAAAFRAWIAKRPADPALRAALVRHLFAHDRLNDALDECQAAIQAIPHHYDLLYLMARVCQGKAERLARTQGGRGTAAMYLEDVVRFAGEAKALAPTRREPRALLGMSLFGLGRTESAAAEADELCRLFPQHPGGFILRAEIGFRDYLAKRREGRTPAKEVADLVARIRRELRQAIALDEGRVVPYRRLGDLAAWEGETDHALSLYAEALARDPSRGAPLAWIEDNASQDKRAAMWERAIRLFRERGTKPLRGAADLHWHAGLARYRLGAWAEARDHMKQCWALREDYRNALFWLGLAAFQLGDDRTALHAFVTYAQRSPEQLAAALRGSGKDATVNTGILAHFADLAHDRGDRAGSRDLNHAIALFDDTAERWNNYAFLCRETGRYEQAWSAYERAVARAPADPQILNDAAVILQYHLHRDLDRAKRMYEHAIALAKKLTSDPKTSRADRTRYRQALQDARGNLLKMKRQAKGKGL